MTDADPRKTKVTHEALGFDELSKLEVFAMDEFCRWARLSRSTVYRSIKTGKLASVKLGSRVMIRRDDALRFIAGLPPS